MAESWEAFVERVLATLHSQRERHELGVKTDVLIYMGRKDKQTGLVMAPAIQVRQEF